MRRVVTILAVASGLVLLLGLAVWLTPVKEGLTGRYYFSDSPRVAPVHTLTDLPPFTARLVQAWPPPVPEVFSATWNGGLLIETAGPYTFSTISDDGSKLYVDGALVVDNGGPHGPLEKRGTATLSRGVHPLLIEYDQRGGDYQLDVRWARGGGALEALPGSVLASRVTSLVRFRVIRALWTSLAAAEWTWFAALVILAGALIGRALEPLRAALEREALWPALRWVLAGSLVLNATGLWWGLPGRWVPIELAPKDLFAGVAQHYSHGWFDAYPPLHFYLLSIAIAPVQLLGWMGRLDLALPEGEAWLVVTTRLVSLAMAAGIVVAVARCGRRAFGAPAGILAAAVFALVSPFLYYAKTANTDVPYLFWFGVSMVCYLRVLDGLRLPDFLGFAAVATAAVCTKDQAYGM